MGFYCLLHRDRWGAGVHSEVVCSEQKGVSFCTMEGMSFIYEPGKGFVL